MATIRAFENRQEPLSQSLNTAESRNGNLKPNFSQSKIRHLDALSNQVGVIAAAAMDQRGSLAKSIAAAKGVPLKDITDEMMQEFKTAVTRILTPYASAIL